MSWEVFDRQENSTVSRRGPPALYISRDRKRLTINQSAHRAIGSAEYVVLLRDQSGGRIGIRPCAEDDPSGYRMAASRTLTPTTFLRTVSLPSGHYALTVEDGMLVTEALK